MRTRVPLAPKARLRPAIDRARTLAEGDEIDIRVKVLSRRKLKPSASVVTRDMVTIKIPGHSTPVTVELQSLLDPDT
jgi:hypothetical protein